MKVLVTGFEPFGGEMVNPALEAIFALPKHIKGAEIIPLKIPTVFGRSLTVIEAAIKKEQPDVVLSIGQAGGIAGLAIEAVAINLNEARIADNEGNQPCDQKIFDDGENAYFSTLPIKAMCAAVHKKQIPASISYSAGTFVCNHVFYGVRYLAEKRYPQLRSGFIHIPYLVEQCVDKRNMPSMSLPVIVEGLTAAIEAIVEEQPITEGNFGTLY